MCFKKSSCWFCHVVCASEHALCSVYARTDTSRGALAVCAVWHYEQSRSDWILHCIGLFLARAFYFFGVNSWNLDCAGYRAVDRDLFAFHIHKIWEIIGLIIIKSDLVWNRYHLCQNLIFYILYFCKSTFLHLIDVSHGYKSIIIQSYWLNCFFKYLDRGSPLFGLGFVNRSYVFSFVEWY